jgi:hypothetical protein
MPADSETPTGQVMPVTFRPLGVRIAVVALGVFLFVVSAVVWFAFPESVREQFTILQRLTLVGFGLVLAGAGYAMARCRVEARPEGLVAVNGFRSHLYPWDHVSGVTLRAGGPWAILELSDGSTAAAMGIQGSDGSRAVAQVKQLRALVSDHAAPPA